MSQEREAKGAVRAPYHPPIPKHVRDAVEAKQILAQDAYLYLILRSYRNEAKDYKQCNPGHELLAREMGITVDGVKKQLRRLRSARLIWWQHNTRSNGRHTSNQYWLTDYAPLKEVRMPDWTPTSSTARTGEEHSEMTATTSDAASSVESSDDSQQCPHHLFNRDLQRCLHCGVDEGAFFRSRSTTTWGATDATSMEEIRASL